MNRLQVIAVVVAVVAGCGGSAPTATQTAPVSSPVDAATPSPAVASPTASARSTSAAPLPTTSAQATAAPSPTVSAESTPKATASTSPGTTAPEGAAPPYGVAANGLVAYSDNGDILVRDVESGAVTLVVGGPEIDVAPAFSRDGSLLAFIRIVSEQPEVVEVMIASPDGSMVYTAVEAEPAGQVHWSEWSPESAPHRLVVVNNAVDVDNAAGVPPLSIVKVVGSPERRAIELPLKVGATDWRPHSDELIFLAREAEAPLSASGFYAVGVDGTGLRELVPPPELAGRLIAPFSLSHDGRFLAYTSASSAGHVSSHILDLDSGEARTLGGWFNQGWTTFSPDGERLALVRYPGTGAAAQAFIGSSSGDGTDAVAIGPEVQNEPGMAGLRIQFSPDGTYLLIVHAAAGEAWLADVATGEYEAVDLGDDQWVSWQRLAP